MELIGYYAIFAVSISITICIFYFWPLIVQAKAQGVVNAFTQHPKLSALVYIFLSSIVAPLLVLPLLSNQMAEKFQAGLAKEVLKPD